MSFRILVINPGSTSTKISLFEDETPLFEKSIFHESAVLLKFAHVNDQMPFRYGVILEALREHGIPPETIDAFAGRCGGACSQPGGLIEIDQRLSDDAAVGMEAILLGKRGEAKISVGDWGRLKNTHGHDIWCAIGHRAVREYAG